MKYEDYKATSTAEIIAGFDSRPELLVQILRAFVDRFGYISEDAMRDIAAGLNLSRADVYGVVSYYHDFRTEPAGQHIVKICSAEACQSMGSRALAVHASRKLGVDMHSTSDEVTLEPVYCLGNCACSPAIMVDGKTYGRVDAARFDAIIDAMGEAR